MRLGWVFCAVTRANGEMAADGSVERTGEESGDETGGQPGQGCGDAEPDGHDRGPRHGRRRSHGREFAEGEVDPPDQPEDQGERHGKQRVDRGPGQAHDELLEGIGEGARELRHRRLDAAPRIAGHSLGSLEIIALEEVEVRPREGTLLGDDPDEVRLAGREPFAGEPADHPPDERSPIGPLDFVVEPQRLRERCWAGPQYGDAFAGVECRHDRPADPDLLAVDLTAAGGEEEDGESEKEPGGGAPEGMARHGRLRLRLRPSASRPLAARNR